MAQNESIAQSCGRTRRVTHLFLGIALTLSAFMLVALPRTSAAAESSGGVGFSAAEVLGNLDASGTTAATGTPSLSPTRTVGRSVLGRRIVLETFGAGPRHILIVGGVHGNEYGGPVVARFSAYLRAHPGVIPAGTRVDVIACANPDGAARSKRANARKVDLNRNFPARNWIRKRGVGGASSGVRPGSEPETKALLGVLASGQYVRVLSMHSRGGIVDYNGPGGWTLAKRISRIARVPIHRLGAYHGSMGSFIPQKYRIPIVTWELDSRRLTTRVRSGMLAAIK